MNWERIQAEMKNGLALACASCKHYWEGREKGLSGIDCTTPGPCGGPSAGLGFPHYKGPVSDFSQWCFACGSRPDLGIKVSTSERIFGICREHLWLLDRIQANNPNAAVLNVVSPSKGMIVPLKGRYTEKSLMDVMMETEEEWAEEDKIKFEEHQTKWV